MQLHRVWILFWVFLVLAGSVANGFAATKIRLALNWKPEPEFGGFYAAQQEGLFKTEGLDVEIVVGGAMQPVTQMVAAGKVEYGITSADEVLIARSKGTDLVAIFAVYQTNPQCIMVHEESGISSLQALLHSGSTVALQRGLPYAEFLNKTFGFTKVKPVPYAGGIGGFLHDPKFAQQCFVFSEPIAARRAGAKPRTFLIADVGFNPYATVLVTRGKTKATPAAAAELHQKMVRASRKGWNLYLKSPHKTNAYMHTLNDSLDLATYEEAARVQVPLVKNEDMSPEALGTMKLIRWKELQEQLLGIKLQDHAIDVSEAFRNF